MQSKGEKIGRLIKKLRTDERLTQEQLAERAGITPNYLGEIERGKKAPSVYVTANIAQGLNMAPSELMKGLDPKKKSKPDSEHLVRVARAVEGLSEKEIDFVLDTIKGLKNLSGK